MISIDTENDMDTEKDCSNNKILQIFINIYYDFMDLILILIFNKLFLNQIHCQSIRKIILIVNVHY